MFKTEKTKIEIKTANDTNTQCEIDKVHAKQTINKLTSENERLNNDLQELSKAFVQQSELVGEQQTTIVSLQKRIDELENKSAERIITMKKMKRKMESHIDQIHRYEQKLKWFAERMSDYDQTRNDTIQLEADNERLREKLKAEQHRLSGHDCLTLQSLGLCEKENSMENEFREIPFQEIPKDTHVIDTDILIFSLRGDKRVQSNFIRNESAPKAFSIISFGELLVGAKKSKQSETNLGLVYRLRVLFPEYHTLHREIYKNPDF